MSSAAVVVGSLFVHSTFSKFFSVIKGQGELDRHPNQTSSSLDTNKVLEGCPYLLLDIRDKDAYDQCHIISGRYCHKNSNIHPNLF